MVLQNGRAVVRLPQLGLQCLGSQRLGLHSFSTQRVAALYNTFDSRKAPRFATYDTPLTSIISRAYATTKPVSRPKAHTGRTTTAARKAPTTSKTKAAKKPAPDTTAPKAIPKTKSKAKPRINPKPKPGKKAKAKSKSKRKPSKKAKDKPKRKALTEADKDKKLIHDLKTVALRPPHGTPSTAWTVFCAEAVQSRKGKQGAETFAPVVKDAAARFKNLLPEELEHYNHIANQNKAANNLAYRQWIESHSPTVIHEANLARAKLKRRKVKGYTVKLQDHRQVKGFRNAFTYFSIDRYSTGDFKGLKVAEAARLRGAEWKALSPSEKKPYEDAAAADMVRYTQEKKTVYDKDVKHKARAAPAA